MEENEEETKEKRYPFDCADKPAEKYCWLIYCERKTLFRLKKQAEKYEL
jgi:hypothetical protein